MMDRKELLDRLTDIIQLEQACAALEKTIQLLENKAGTLGGAANILKPSEPAFLTEKQCVKGKWSCNYIWVGVVFMVFPNILIRLMDAVIGNSDIVNEVPAAYILLGFFIVAWIASPVAAAVFIRNHRKHITEQKNGMIKNKYLQEVKKYEALQEKDQERIRKEKTEKEELLRLESRYRTQLSQYRRICGKCYEASGIYNLYWNIEAAIAFFHYFSSGQCDTLKEAYNAYGVEHRLERIEMEIGEINRNLRSICTMTSWLNDNQRKLMDGVNQTNSFLEDVSGKIGNIEKISVANEINLSVQAYQSKMILDTLQRMREDN